MGIGIKILGGIGIAASLAFGANLPVMAATVTAGNDARTITTNKLADIGFKITDLKARSISGTWDATKTFAAGDSTSYCDIDLTLASGQMTGASTGTATVTPGTNTITFGTTQQDGETTESVSPGSAYVLDFTCYNNDGWQVTTYQSPKVTAPDVPVNTPDSTVVRLLNGNDILALPTGGIPGGEQWATSCLFRLYNNGQLVKSAEDKCDGGVSHTFTSLPAGNYTVTTALRNDAGLSGWSPASAAVKIGAASTSTPGITSNKPGNVNLNITQQGKKLGVRWTKAVTHGNGKIVAYNVKIVKGSHTVYNHTFKGTSKVTKKLAHGTYKITVTVKNVHGKQSVTTTKVRL